MKFFKRKDGSVFGKIDSISKKIEEEFFKKGYVRCDADGKEMKSKSKKRK